jgi:hypothetical protein
MWFCTVFRIEFILHFLIASLWPLWPLWQTKSVQRGRVATAPLRRGRRRSTTTA